MTTVSNKEGAAQIARVFVQSLAACVRVSDAASDPNLDLRRSQP
jgi:uncharacterized protein involved in tolerance to divalent cations